MFDKLLGKGDTHQTRDAIVYLFRGFRFLGICPPQSDSRFSYFVYSLILNGLVTVFLPLAFTISFITSTSQMEIGNFLTSLQVAINVYGCAIKIICMGFMVGKLRKAESCMDRLDARCSQSDELAKIRNLVQFGNRMIVIFSIAYFSYSTSTFVTSVMMGRPPYAVYLPFLNWKESKTDFVLSAAIEYILIDVACFQQVVDDSYVVIYIFIIRTHIQILLTRIEKLGTDGRKTAEEHFEDLVNCIIDHKNVLELLDTVSPVISVTIFIQFVIQAAILGTTLINIVMFATLSSMIASFFYIVAVVTETLPCCYQANCLMDESDQLATAIFHSNWPEQDVRYRKMLVFFMQKTQQTITLNAMKLFPITLNTNLNIGKFSFSLYTLMSTMDFGAKFGKNSN